MKKCKGTEYALITSMLSILLCMAMLVVSTFAWFSGSVTYGNNIIAAGTLDVELDYATEFNTDGSVKTWTTVDSTTALFKDLEEDGKTENLWEPGHTEYVCLRIRNAGTLALKYQFDVNVYGDKEGRTDEKLYTNVNGDPFRLSDYLVFKQIDGAKKVGKREDLWTAEKPIYEFKNCTFENTYVEFNDGSSSAIAGKDTSKIHMESERMLPGAEKVMTLAVYMPTEVTNDANYNKNTDRPEIYLGLTLAATQIPFERDDFNDDYDNSALVSEDDCTYVKDEDELFNALKAGSKNIVFANDIEITKACSSQAGTDTFTIDLNGKTLTANNSLDLHGAGSTPVHATVKNGTFKTSSQASGCIRFNEYGSSCVFEKVNFKSGNNKLNKAVMAEVSANDYISFEGCRFNIENPRSSCGAIDFGTNTTGKLNISDCSFNVKPYENGTGGTANAFAIHHGGSNGDNQGTLVDVTLNNVTFVGEKVLSSTDAETYCTSACIGAGKYEEGKNAFSVTETGTNSYTLKDVAEAITTDCWGNKQP